MNDSSTIANARNQIAEVRRAFDKADLAKAVSYSLGWLACLLAAELIDKTTYELLILELEEAQEDMKMQFKGKPSTPRRQKKIEP